MSTIYGYCRISTAKQSIERQERNILAEYPTARIIKEVFTGTKVEGRKDFDKLFVFKSTFPVGFKNKWRCKRILVRIFHVNYGFMLFKNFK